MSKAIYPGSFDPVTNGHVNIIERAARIFDGVVVAVATNSQKTGMFDVGERMEMLKACVGSVPGVEVDSFEGLLVDYARRREATIVIRGLRAVSDFEYEFQMAHMNHQLHPMLETVFMVTGTTEFYISSQLVKEVARLGGSVDELVPAFVRAELKRKIDG
ncbi:MAG: pantetheine-phosphate adenylyltransferase [Deltaproteobacteria bacterium]|nr:pantetheine-phosphate adenylyltransferase [Deltaproteobacteria bacterium]